MAATIEMHQDNSPNDYPQDIQPVEIANAADNLVPTDDLVRDEPTEQTALAAEIDRIFENPAEVLEEAPTEEIDEQPRPGIAVAACFAVTAATETGQTTSKHGDDSNTGYMPRYSRPPLSDNTPPPEEKAPETEAGPGGGTPPEEPPTGKGYAEDDPEDDNGENPPDKDNKGEVGFWFNPEAAKELREQAESQGIQSTPPPPEDPNLIQEILNRPSLTPPAEEEGEREELAATPPPPLGPESLETINPAQARKELEAQRRISPDVGDIGHAARKPTSDVTPIPEPAPNPPLSEADRFKKAEALKGATTPEDVKRIMEELGASRPQPPRVPERPTSIDMPVVSPDTTPETPPAGGQRASGAGEFKATPPPDWTPKEAYTHDEAQILLADAEAAAQAGKITEEDRVDLIDYINLATAGKYLLTPLQASTMVGILIKRIGIVKGAGALPIDEGQRAINAVYEATQHPDPPQERS